MGTDSGLLSTRVKAHLNTFFVVLATLVLGNALHMSVVTGEHALTAFPVVAQLVGGLVFGAVGVWSREAPREHQPGTGTDEEEAEEGFDEDLSPLDAESMDRLEE
ncbi:hypothetical protein BRC81_15075 [Halobacteriales archaeon QS_1_68_20]|nr:MAG: hypothetical protein BRC81_15075 [Halobacteriales archaeon QS_1_68_20]